MPHPRLFGSGSPRTGVATLCGRHVVVQTYEPLQPRSSMDIRMCSALATACEVIVRVTIAGHGSSFPRPAPPSQAKEQCKHHEPPSRGVGRKLRPEGAQRDDGQQLRSQKRNLR